jgi:hypothetical protein
VRLWTSTITAAGVTIDVPVVDVVPGDVASCSVTPSAKVGFEYVQVDNDKVTVSAKSYEGGDVDVIIICVVSSLVS